LPEVDDGLELAAADYYGSGQLLPVAGSQAAIQALPRLRSRCRIGVLSPGYAEHAAAWLAAGHEVVALATADIEARLPELDVLLLINPNNPTAECFDSGQLLAWQRQLAERGGWLVVDEAFIDATPVQSLVPQAGREGLIVLRSLGKFFGLAGARVGFVFASPGLLSALAERLGPWSLSGPSREAARLALDDRAWQSATRERLVSESQRLARILRTSGLSPVSGTALFQYCPEPQAARLHVWLARQGILTRLFNDPPALRFGLPGSEAEWQRLQRILTQWREVDG
jgi:cobalamin biosynthetic protein CobC